MIFNAVQAIGYMRRWPDIKRYVNISLIADQYYAFTPTNLIFSTMGAW